jgi:hypothetical protein
VYRFGARVDCRLAFRKRQDGEGKSISGFEDAG